MCQEERGRGRHLACPGSFLPTTVRVCRNGVPTQCRSSPPVTKKGGRGGERVLTEIFVIEGSGEIALLTGPHERTGVGSKLLGVGAGV
jgi:hypothetical protein